MLGRRRQQPGCRSCGRYLSDYLEVPRIMDEDDVIARVHGWVRGRTIDRVLANWEPLVIMAARLRERFGMPGMSVDTVRGFRDKQLMKERVAAAGLRVPHARRVRTVDEVRAALETIGYPAIIKPISGAGSADTYRVDSARRARAVLPDMRHVAEAMLRGVHRGRGVHLRHGLHRRQAGLRERRPVPAERRSRCARTSGSRPIISRCAT